MAIPTGSLLLEARFALGELQLDETPELLELWMRGWCLGYTEGAHDWVKVHRWPPGDR